MSGKADLPWWLGEVDKNIWDSWHKQHGPTCPSEHAARFLSKLPEGSKVLDIGSGNGINCYYMSAIGLNPTGIDGSETAIKAAEANIDFFDLSGDIDELPVFVHGDLTEPLPFEGGQFDAVLDICCIQHLNPSQATTLILEIRRVLKPGGKMFSKLASESTTFREDIQFSPPIFRTVEEVYGLFAEFKAIELNHVERTVKGGEETIAHWLVEAET
ncbi:MAG: Methyltransferase type 11 [Candidatus Gottesmanbacteria bacterium GW2011_GWB1_49_7]|uniref:Methyltransferase type 11 n=1 Tax=Candidatus Gottesmanbacteria bacterium GW2011_GWB1_49_7 TaxID=1618448 RepID=A0A0G1W1H0_9BACT|nr:MAG: Methyltransferase type 11 [Candidatus Gottesmanbacteria bacterium GW2011_GWB1_49_7]